MVSLFVELRGEFGDLLGLNGVASAWMASTRLRYARVLWRFRRSSG